ncbi:MAG TPA: hypothetical protein VMP11_09670 [Verrucomicrobiae bacterium]|nr:hypothetical protein [Verrucomicrobiae bacterium]
MKSVVLFLLLAGPPCAFAQTDTNLIAVGDWSEPVSDPAGYTLRGRLLIYDAEYYSRTKMWGHARVYLELQHICTDVWRNPIEICFRMSAGLHFEMHDGLNKAIPYKSPPIDAYVPTNPYWVTLPCNSTLRLQADPGLCSDSTKPDGVSILVGPDDLWDIRPGATNDYYLSATFRPPTNHPSSLNYYVWQGTLQLPKVKIAVKKP